MGGNKKVILEGRGSTTLRSGDYVGAGGEGSVYRQSATVIKIYADAAKMTRDGMADKVRLLSKIRHPSICAPQGVVFDERRSPVGFYMPWVEGEALTKAFGNDYRTRTGFSNEHAIRLTTAMHEATVSAHNHGAVMVDANELNWIVDKKFFPSVIDVDSWAVGSRWPATVIMPSIRDWHSKDFTESTDWFSWGIITFQVYTGIHPYKGRLDGYGPGDLKQRMLDNKSVFAAGVRLPHSARDPACIPTPLLDWYRSTFQDGDRSTPPSPTLRGAPAKAALVFRTATGVAEGLEHERLSGGRPSPVVKVWASGEAMLADGLVFDVEGGFPIVVLNGLNPEVVRTGWGWLLAYFISGQPTYIHTDGSSQVVPLSLGFNAHRFFRAGDRVFAVGDREMAEIIISFPGRPLLSLGTRIGIRPNSTKWFDGVAVQDVLGAQFLLLPAGNGFIQPRVKELDGMVPLAGYASGRFAAIVAADRNGDYHRVEFTFSSDFSTYTAWQGHNPDGDLNMVALQNGVVATIINDGEIALFVPVNGNVNTIKDKEVTTNLRLYRIGSKVVYVKDGDIWRISVRQKPGTHP